MLALPSSQLPRLPRSRFNSAIIITIITSWCGGGIPTITTIITITTTKDRQQAGVRFGRPLAVLYGYLCALFFSFPRLGGAKKMPVGAVEYGVGA